MNAADFLYRLDSLRSRGPGQWSARCPAHADKSPSLSIRDAGSRILLHDFGGCEPEEIVAALGLELKDLFTDTPVLPGQWPTLKPQKLDLVAVGFHFELAALDRRLRADCVLKAATNFNCDELSEPQRHRLMNAIARAYADQYRAEFLEVVADDFRLKAFHERTECHAA